MITTVSSTCSNLRVAWSREVAELDPPVCSLRNLVAYNSGAAHLTVRTRRSILLSSTPATDSNTSNSSIETEVRRIRGLVKQRHFTQALSASTLLSTQVPENRDVLYLIAVSQRYLGRFTDALLTLEQLERIHPGFARLFQERGHCYDATGEASAAIVAYRRAVTLNVALMACWKALSRLYSKLGQGEQAEIAASQVAQLESLPHPVLTASGMLAEGDILGAEGIVRRFLQTHVNDIEGMRLLAQIGIQLDVLDDAEFLLESVLEFVPDHHIARYEYAVVLGKRHKYAAAIVETRKLLKLEPSNRAYRTLYATVCVGLGDHERALGAFRDLKADAPDNAELHLSIGHALKTLGRQSEAINSYRTAAVVRATFGDAYWSLANLKTYRFTDAEVARMRASESAPTTLLVDRYHLCFALGKALEDRSEYEESFHYYSCGNALKNSECRYDSDSLEKSLQRQMSLFSQDFMASRNGSGYDRPDPIFIVGLPRAGSTLIEQILASHSKVEGTMELADIPRLVQRLQGREQQSHEPRYPRVLAELNRDQLQRLGEKFIDDTRVYRTNKPFFIDKMPNNFRHVGLISLILPNAKIIDCRREPMACCFSNFKQLFAAGQEFTYSLGNIACYYRGYIELMRHWDAVLPGKVLRVQHEQVVEDLEGTVRRILAFVGLEFEQSCLEFYKTERSVRTASSEQVRQPLFREGLDQWRKFERWLEPLEEALGDLARSRGRE
jgi:tetratricopeptide (TPR) repeat protein